MRNTQGSSGKHTKLGRQEVSISLYSSNKIPQGIKIKNSPEIIIYVGIHKREEKKDSKTLEFSSSNKKTGLFFQN